MLSTVDSNRLISHLLLSIVWRPPTRLMEADDHDPIEISAAGLSRHISGPAETDGAICSQPSVHQGRILAGRASSYNKTHNNYHVGEPIKVRVFLY